jgi:hypothetical protein
MTRHYIGTKIIKAWEADKDGNPGYGVIYEDGYTSWSPKATFEASYRAIEGENQALTFGDAVALLKLGKKVARAGWNGKGMLVYLVPGSTFSVSRAPLLLLGIYPEGTQITYRPHLDLRTADGSVSTWAPSNSDALAEDWMVVE